jgi:hypothetical protein
MDDESSALLRAETLQGRHHRRNLPARAELRRDIVYSSGMSSPKHTYEHSDLGSISLSAQDQPAQGDLGSQDDRRADDWRQRHIHQQVDTSMDHGKSFLRSAAASETTIINTMIERNLVLARLKAMTKQ